MSWILAVPIPNSYNRPSCLFQLEPALDEQKQDPEQGNPKKHIRLSGAVALNKNAALDGETYFL